MNEIELAAYVDRIVHETTPESLACYLRSDITDREAALAQQAVRRRGRPKVIVSRGSITINAVLTPLT